MTARRCFVISPIGEPRSETREHVDDLFKYVIAPAMDELGIAAYRADHDNQVGRISDQMFRSILTDDLCIAVLTFQNPNVYYELAVAQAAARPVIILSLKGTPIPFDIKDMRVIEYDFRPRSVIEKVYVRQIVEMVQNLEAQGWKGSVPFGHNLTPLGGGAGPVRFHDRVEGYGPSDAWLGLLRGAKRAIDLSGITLRYWTRIPNFRAILQERAAAGCRVRVLLMHPNNPALPQYMNPQLKWVRDNATPEVEASYNFFSGLGAEFTSIEVRRMLVGSHHQQVLRADGTLLTSLVLYSEAASRSPLIESTEDSAFYRSMLDEFDALWAANAEGPTAPVTPAETTP